MKLHSWRCSRARCGGDSKESFGEDCFLNYTMLQQNRCYIGFQSSSSRCDKISQAFCTEAVSTAAASDEENPKGFLRRLSDLGFRF